MNGLTTNGTVFIGAIKLIKNNPNGRYDYDQTCMASGNNSEPDSCCGDEYPKRFPYNSGEKECCSKAGKLYSYATQECCDDGTIQSTCDLA